MPDHSSDKPLDWVVRFASTIKPEGTVLDLACGHGRHSQYLADEGFRVTALDRDISAVSEHPDMKNIEVIKFDLENGSSWPFGDLQFDGIVVTNYLHRPLFPEILNSLSENGVLIYETFSLGNEQYGRPSNPNFLLKPGELLDICLGTLQIIAFEEGLIEVPSPAVKQRICAIRKTPEADPVSI
ncbi:MAG: SAM-dependent methyltransferase [Rhodospirillaceae bacterium]|nr:SAM-dependent methyltransferase [Rhodospirillaceae bacterium]|tara:strand:+ start:33177 stop:33728 length:552 start_codon:yes stop_codon:yes gene_type:complete